MGRQEQEGVARAHKAILAHRASTRMQTNENEANIEFVMESSKVNYRTPLALACATT
jgi:hypothetical protein